MLRHRQPEYTVITGSSWVQVPVFRMLITSDRTHDMRKYHLACATALTALLWAAGAQAQPQPQYQQQQQQQGPDQMLERLHYDLRLNPGQEGVWQAFQQSYREDPRAEEEDRNAQQRMAHMTGPQRIDMSIHMAERDLDTMRRQGDALKTLYAALSPQQQRVFDRDTLEQPDQSQGNYQSQGQGQGGYQGNYPSQGGYPPPRNY
jgi:protein CpxP